MFGIGREEAPPDTIKLSRAEQRLKAELEPVIASELPALLQAALALRRIRNARLFRTEAATFSEYLARKYSLPRSTGSCPVRRPIRVEQRRLARVSLGRPRFRPVRRRDIDHTNITRNGRATM